MDPDALLPERHLTFLVVNLQLPSQAQCARRGLLCLTAEHTSVSRQLMEVKHPVVSTASLVQSGSPLERCLVSLACLASAQHFRASDS